MWSKLIIFFLLFLVSCSHNDFSSLSANQKIGIIFVLVMSTLIVGAIIVQKRRVQNIKRSYDHNKQQLHFWDKLDRLKLESMLKNNQLPKNWIFKLNQERNKINDIYFYDGQSLNRIAQDKVKLFDSLRKRIKKS